jgi:hypothetical protein
MIFVDRDLEWLPVAHHGEIDRVMRKTFDSQLLGAHDVKCVSFLWFFTCSLNPVPLFDSRL